MSLRELFNEDQRRHMCYLATISPERRCWNGWCLLPDRCDCSAPMKCPGDVSLADRLMTEQPCCGRPAVDPWSERTFGSHYAECKPCHRDAFAIELGLIDLGGEAG